MKNIVAIESESERRASMSLFRMTEEEYDKLNPPPDILFTGAEGWHYLGHIPAPTTRFGWFMHDLIHGLAMRYRLLPVLACAFRGLMDKRQRLPGSILFQLDDEESAPNLDCHYDDESDTLYIHLHGNRSNVVDWVNNRVALLRDETSNDVIGFMVEGYQSFRNNSNSH